MSMAFWYLQVSMHNCILIWKFDNSTQARLTPHMSGGGKLEREERERTVLRKYRMF